MDRGDALAALAALGHETRLEVFRLLAREGARGLQAGEIALALGVLHSTLSAHLAALHRAGLVRSRREGRAIRYFADMAGMRALLAFLLEDCCGGRPELCRPALFALAPAAEEAAVSDIRNVLFLCTGNSARSIMAEAIINREGLGRFRGFSAGSQPKGEIHPYALDLLKRLNHDTSALRSKSWDEFADPGAPQMDFVFTVCDRAAAEQCPYWPGQPMTAHWGVPDPAAAGGNEAEKRVAFSEAYRILRTRISIFVSLPMESLDRLALQRRLDEIGRTAPAAEAS